MHAATVAAPVSWVMVWAALASSAGVLLALGIAVLTQLNRRADLAADTKRRLDHQHIELLQQVMDTIAGRLHVSRGASSSHDDLQAQVTQYRREILMPAWLELLPRHLTILLRYSEAPARTPLWPTFEEIATGVRPWEKHPQWKSTKPTDPGLLLEDLTASVHALATGRPKHYPGDPRPTINSWPGHNTT